MFQNHLSCVKNSCLVKIYKLTAENVKTRNKFHRTNLPQNDDLFQQKGDNNTYLSLDHIKTGTGKALSEQQHTKREIKLTHKKKEDEAAILEKLAPGT